MPSVHLRRYLKTITVQEQIDVQSQKAWNLRNSEKFAMAPTALVESGQVNDQNYAEECAKFDKPTDHFKQYEVAELGLINHESTALNPDHLRIWTLGWGQGHGMGYIPDAFNCGIEVHVGDHSKTALDAALRYLKEVRKTIPRQRRHNLPPAPELIHLADFVYVMNAMILPHDSMIDASRIVHHTSEQKQAEFWTGCGHFLAGNDYFEKPPFHRRVVITNPEARDNERWIAGKGAETTPKWKSVKPFNIEDVLPCISKAAAHEVKLERESDPFEVFGEIFRISTIMLKR